MQRCHRLIMLACSTLLPPSSLPMPYRAVYPTAPAAGPAGPDPAALLPVARGILARFYALGWFTGCSVSWAAASPRPSPRRRR